MSATLTDRSTDVPTTVLARVRTTESPGRATRTRLAVTEPSTVMDPFFGLSVTQVLGSALAAATSALAASALGVAGTIIGALVGSLVATVGAAIYAHSLRTAGARLRIVRVQTLTAAPGSPVVDGAERRIERSPRGRLRVVIGVVLGVVLALAGVTAVEQFLGHPLSNGTTTGTSIGQAVTGSAPQRSARQTSENLTPAVTSTPSTRATPTTPITTTSQPGGNVASSTATIAPAPTGTSSVTAPSTGATGAPTRTGTAAATPPGSPTP